MPVRKGSTVYVQQDNAGPHVLEDDSELEAADLGYFSSIQALQYRKACYDTSSLITAVHEAFQELRWQTLDKCFVTK
ncbi:hypothetical protein Pcac1_g25594 [Phytophthora cactorum]|uniref:Uncharacterized protein n=1 Tax=Phytophthora cactorum TaxID=29920 RepID=A0A8T1EYB2_9STRA|nr:hypothetical protein Pcac1_g25594 [Phytophthora cactorum]KAG2795489.1 hypothetical protein PC112_g22621 [Phytophthora cactorum]KAG2821373.1 hypothetical protein PC113_g22488 [Phytophthora cactorum]KAG2881443.1 hypothetical protein PC115_g22234 [Phytophthora cactorum]KAG2888250.1 hypothetical protein PC117_g24954 [Phytophthora cactorum]